MHNSVLTVAPQPVWMHTVSWSGMVGSVNYASTSVDQTFLME